MLSFYDSELTLGVGATYNVGKFREFDIALVGRSGCFHRPYSIDLILRHNIDTLYPDVFLLTKYI